MKKPDIWILFNIVLASLLIYSSFNLVKAQQSNESYIKEVKSLKNFTKEMEKAVIAAQKVSLMYSGKDLQTDKLQNFINEKENLLNFNGGKLILFFDELGCDACLDNETRFLQDIADTFGKNRVLAIVSAETPKYIRNYIRVNQINFTVYRCFNKKFSEKNSIKNSPMLFLTDHSGVIVAAHYPIPGHPQYSEGFHNLCMNFFLEHQNQEILH